MSLLRIDGRLLDFVKISAGRIARLWPRPFHMYTFTFWRTPANGNADRGIPKIDFQFRLIGLQIFLAVGIFAICAPAHSAFFVWKSAKAIPNGCPDGTGGPSFTANFPDALSGLMSHCNAQNNNCGAIGLENIVIDEVNGTASAACYITDRFGKFHFEVYVSSGRSAAVDGYNKGVCRDCQISTAHPINLGTLNKYLVETDYVGMGPFPLRFTRYYNSNDLFVDVNSVFGSGGLIWRHSFQRSITLMALPAGAFNAQALRGDGKGIGFALQGGTWQTTAPFPYRLVRLTDSGGNPTGWQFLNGESDEVETYDVNGRLLSIANRAGLLQTLSYDATGRLSAVTDPFARTLTFTYDATGRLATMTEPAGGVFQYAYAPNKNGLVSVTDPDNKVLTYLYENANKSLVTGIADQNGARYATFSYAGTLAISSELAGGVDKITITAGGPCCDGTVTTTDSLGQARRLFYGLAGSEQILRVPGTLTQPCNGCTKTFDYFSTGYVSLRLDFNSNRTSYLRAEPGRPDLETSRTEGLTSGGGVIAGVTRTVTTAWNPSFRLPTLIIEKSSSGTTLRATTMTYDTTGNMLTRTITDTASAKSRTWTNTYNANGQPLTMDGPRTDVNDTTTYTYYANNDADLGKRGNLATITNARGHVTSITAYNAHGQPLTIVDPNGLTTTLTYDVRQRLTSRTVGGETTSYTYDGVGQLTKVTLPDGSFLNYTYDAAHRLTQIADSLGNKIVYTLDTMGNRTQEQVFDPTNALAQTRSRVYSSLNRLTQEIGAGGQTTTYAYDTQGNVTSIDGPLAGTADTTTNLYDQLNRLTRMTDPNAGQVNYTYNPLDQMTSVKDPRNLTTNYAYDALNNLNQLTSPDTGATQNTYDAAGNLLTQLDAKGQTTTYTYDALNRVTSIGYATDPGLDVSFTYDQGTYGLGRLTGVTDSTGTMSYAYEIHGRLASETRVIGGVTYTTAYSYDSAGRLASMTYPGGRQITYTRDGLGRVGGITTTKNNITQTLLNAVVYRPFGPEQAYTFGNNQTYARGFDQDGRIAAYSQPGQTVAVSYDNASRITAITDTSTPSNVLTYNYDLLDRVTSFTAPALSLNQGFGYDAVGNRTSQTIGANNYTSTYGATSNRIATTTGPTPKAFIFDANGSITNDTVNQYTFDARGRLKQATTAVGISQYLVNTMGQRVKKSVAGIDTVFHYDSGGRLISETDGAGNVKQEYVYLNDIPLAVLK